MNGAYDSEWHLSVLENVMVHESSIVCNKKL